MWKLDGRTVLVTGASGGIGGATVRHLVRAGADVIASGRSGQALDALAAETGCLAGPFDLTSEESIRAAMDGLDLWGVVNSGGFGGEIATPMETDIAVFDKVISINARGALLVTKYAAKSMIRLGKGGAIVNVSSQAASSRCPGMYPTAPRRARWRPSRKSPRSNSAAWHPRQRRESHGCHDTDVRLALGCPEIGGPFLERMPLGRWATVDDVRLFAQRRGVDDNRRVPADRRRLLLLLSAGDGGERRRRRAIVDPRGSRKIWRGSRRKGGDFR